MLSYIDIEAFATANYRATTQSGSTSQNTHPANLPPKQLAMRRKQMTERILAAAKPTKTRQTKPSS